ncbi:MAG TPA: imelysin family protein [Polyangiaceae bacterium]|nr:imelysin family protein [Polyangiaceae bacterium]
MSRLSLSCLSGVLSACCLLGCGNTDAPPRDYGPLLHTLSEQVILPEHQAFASKADALASSMQALVDNPNADSLAGTQQAWRATRQAYRILDALHFGPGYTLHISERIDVAPAEPDGIEALAAGNGTITDSTISKAGGHEKGFLGLEYLLFADISKDADARAPALAGDDLAAKRRELALAMAHEIQNSAHQLDDAWEPGAGGFVTQLETAGRGSTAYNSQRAAVDAMVGGVAYALEMIVGVRLATPLGRKSGSGPDPSLDPTRRSDNAIADLQATLTGIGVVYDGDGFSSAVRVQSTKLDEAVETGLSDIAQSLAVIPKPFSDAVVNDTALVKAAYDAGVDLKKTWNTDVSSALGATLKPSDTDGD